MSWDEGCRCDLNAYSQTENVNYTINPNDIYVPPGYRVSAFLQGLELPSSMTFTDRGALLIAESGYLTDNPRVMYLTAGGLELLAEGFHTPITGITYHDGEIIVSHRGTISAIGADGGTREVISGLPSYGDYLNSNVVFGQDGKMYFGQGTTTNSGVVGTDNTWVHDYPLAHDYTGSYMILVGQNFTTENVLVGGTETVNTGAFSPYGVPNLPFEIRKGIVKASGSILRCNPDGTGLEIFAEGFRNPTRIRFDEEGRLFSANQGYASRGSRPIVNAPDCMEIVQSGTWYGWPDYAGGAPVTSPRFKPEGGRQPEFLLTSHPNIPPRPYAIFPQGSNVMGFDFCYNTEYSAYGDIYIAEFGGTSIFPFQGTSPHAGIGHRISRISSSNRGVTTFAINKSGFPSYVTGEGGFGRPIEVHFGPDHALYILDMGRSARNDPNTLLPDSGLIWRISRVLEG